MRHTFRYLLDAPVAPGARVVLGRDDSHHLTRVVRRRTGDAIEVGDGVGGAWSATVVALSLAIPLIGVVAGSLLMARRNDDTPSDESDQSEPAPVTQDA